MCDTENYEINIVNRLFSGCCINYHLILFSLSIPMKMPNFVTNLTKLTQTKNNLTPLIGYKDKIDDFDNLVSCFRNGMNDFLDTFDSKKNIEMFFQIYCK